MLALAFGSPFYQIIVYLFAQRLASGQRDDAEGTYRDGFKISFSSRFVMKGSSLSVHQAFSVHTDILSGQLTDFIVARDSGKDTVRVSVPQFFQRKVGGDDGSLFPHMALVQKSKSWDVTNWLVSSVPRSSMISRSH